MCLESLARDTYGSLEPAFWSPPQRREPYSLPVSSHAQPARLLQSFNPLGALRHLACSHESLVGERIPIVKISLRGLRVHHVK